LIFNWLKDAIDDVEGAQNCGMLGILVKTGKYRDGDEEKINKKPALVADNFSQAVDFILENYAL
jgi:ribonucleotide monophosphatase NagD (HAD superfamily)